MARTGGIPASYQVEDAASRGQERSLSIRIGHWGGAEARPTRVFLWLGERGNGAERLLATGRGPRLLRVARRRRHLNVRGVSLSYLGNPAVTLGLLCVNLLRRSSPRQKTARTRDPVGGP